MKKYIFILVISVLGGSSSLFSMCTPTGCVSSYPSIGDAICNGPVITQDGACVTGDNTNSTACLTGGCAAATGYSQLYMQFTATSTSVVIDFTSSGIQNADVALITNSADGCGGTDVNTCPAVGGLCIESCNTSVGGGSLSINPTSLTVGVTYVLMIQSEYEPTCSGVDDQGTFDICITTDPCRNGIQDGAETGIDCGGACAPCAVTNDDCVDDIGMVLDNTLAIGSGATNTCTQTLCTDANTDDCYIQTGPGCNPGCCLSPYMSCGSIENNTWYTFTPATTDSFYFALENQICGNGDGMQMWIGTLPSGCGDASTYNEIFCQSTATTADITNTLFLTAGVTYTVTLDGFAGDDCTFDFGVYSVNPLLPVELVNFTGEYFSDKKAVGLDWVSSSEINNDYYTIERSRDGFIYEVVDVITGSGNSNTLKEYKLEDKEPFNGVNYYRLKQTDYDGNSKNKGVVAINVSTDADISLFPTITTANVNLNIFFSLPTYTNILVYNAIGELVFDEKIELSRGKSSYVIPSEGFDSGVYFVKVNSLNSNNSQSLKFIKN